MKKIYLLFIFIALTGYGYGQIIISQYYEGASYNKWIEITNVGASAVDLTSPQLYLCLYTNASADDPGNNSPGYTQTFSGTINPGQVLLFQHSSAALPSYASGTNSTPCNFNGDDLLITTTVNGGSTAWTNRVDVIGNGTSWGGNKSFYRNSNVTSTNTTYTTSEWTEVTNAAVDGANSSLSEYLGTHLYSSGGGNLPPEITAISNTPALPTSSQSVSVSADITDSDGTISTAVLNWGTTSGALNTAINMSASGNTYTILSNIPAQANNATVYYEIVATDNEAGSTTTSEQDYFVLDATNIVINEFLADPAANLPGDANGDGVRDGSDDEFVELVNSSSTSIDLSGYTLNDATELRHTFPNGTILQPNDAVVVFGGGTPTGFDFYDVQIASSGALGLNNSGDDIVLKDADGLIVVSVTYGSDAGDNQSLTRDPDISGTSFVKHSDATGSGGSLFSPNKTISGTEFRGLSVWDGDQADNNWNTAANWSNGVPTTTMRAVIPASLTYYLGIASAGPICNSLLIESGASLVGVDNLTVNGVSTVERSITAYIGDTDGYHFLSSPVSSFTIAGSDFVPTASNDDLYEWDETTNTWLNYYGTFDDTEFEVGKGYMAAYKTDPSGKFYGNLNTTSSTKNLTFTSGQGDGWNLLGNPYPSAIDWDEITKTASVDGTVYVLRGTDNTYVSWNGSTGDLTDGHIPINNGFFVKTSTTGQSVTMDVADQVQSTSLFLKNEERTIVENTLKLSISNEVFANNAYIQFRSDASAEFDNSIDAYKLINSSDAPQLFTSIDDINYAINCIPFSTDEVQLPIGIVNSKTSEYTISVAGIESFTDQNFEVHLEDTENGSMINLATDTYTFSADNTDYSDRFVLHFYGVTSTLENMMDSKLSIFAYDNTVNIKFNQLPTSNIQVDVLNIMGKQVYSSSMQPALMSNFILNEKAGVYIIKVSSDNGVQSQKIMIK